MKWFFDFHPPIDGFKTGQQIKKVVFSKRSAHQIIRICDTTSFGRILTLDDALQLTERDEFIYHEMLVHPVLFAHPNPQRVLVIGGGDGGALREVLKHNVREVYLVDIDAEVVKAAKKHLHRVHRGAFDDRRVRVIIEDGQRFLADPQWRGCFDVIIVDSTDPLPENMACPLFQKRFLAKAAQALRPDGILSYQAGSIFFARAGYLNIYRKVAGFFPHAGIYWTTIPSFSGAIWGFVYGAKTLDLKRIDPRKNRVVEFTKIWPTLKFYNLDVHAHSFSLPNFVHPQ